MPLPAAAKHSSLHFSETASCHLRDKKVKKEDNVVGGGEVGGDEHN
jgi:hypothetical protein